MGRWGRRGGGGGGGLGWDTTGSKVKGLCPRACRMRAEPKCALGGEGRRGKVGRGDTIRSWTCSMRGGERGGSGSRGEVKGVIR